MTVTSRIAPSGRHLSEGDSQQVIAAAAGQMAVAGKRVLVLLPDHTRSCPLPMIARQLHAALAPAAARLDFLIALGTHPPLSEQQIDRLLGVTGDGSREKVFPRSTVFNHRWKDPAALVTIGTLEASRIRDITGGKFEMDVPVTINKLVFDYDVVLVAGPVFPHEVVGFSGGSKYFFPGICGAELLNFFHWLGAVITNPKIIGNKRTPVRDTLEAAADMLLSKNFEKFGLSMVVTEHELAGLFFGPVRESWSAAADLSDKLHITYMDRPFESVLSRAPEMYDDLWTGGKCMYKMEPVVADGGELIIYAPHITEISVTHGKVIEQIGYHTRDFFLAQWDKYKHFPWGVLAHSTHVRGIGTYENGVEKCRVRVTLATGIPEALCCKINLGYRDPKTIDISHWQGHEGDGRLYVPQAGERLYKLKNPPAWQRPD
jgi:nickel-dependent lactate racemase